MLYKYTGNSSQAISNIKNHALWFNTINSFNDPFDIYPAYKMDEEERQQAMLLFQKTKDIDIGVAATFTAEELSVLERLQDRFMPVENSKSGVTCFSEERDNIIMWSHYANSHKGLCLGFDITENSKIGDFLDETIVADTYGSTVSTPCNVPCTGKIYKINYNETRPQLIIGKKEPQTEFLEVKFIQWAYEKEWRIMLHANQSYVFPRLMYYKPYLLKELIFGANMCWGEFIKTYLQTKDYIKYHSVKTFCAALNDVAYKLNMNEISLEEYERLKNNYQQYEDVELFGHLEKITAFSQKYGKRSLQTYWKEAIYEFPMQYTRLLPEAKYLKQYKGQVQVPLDIAKAVGLFINWMYENMTYLKEKNIRPKKRIVYT